MNMCVGCEESLFCNFEILSLPAPSTTHLVPNAPSPSPDFIKLFPSNPTLISPSNPDAIHLGRLALNFTSSKDTDDYPFLFFQTQASTEMKDDKEEELQMCAVGWAKRREFDDEFPGVDTVLSASERGVLEGRREVDMGELEREMLEDGLEEGEVKE